VHIQELRNALHAARTSLGLSALTYTDPAVAAGTRIKAAHLQELCNGLK
jgi:hypothetical protein